MKNIRQIAFKELSAFFSSLAAFIFFGVFLVAIMFIFFWADPFFARNTADLRPVLEWMPTLMVFLVSALTMRMWSEERRAGTIEFLLTSPVSNIELILGKFVACLILVMIALALTLPLPITVSLVGPLDWGPVIGGYIASIFLAAAYTAIGLFVSSQSDNQIVSLIVSSAVCMSFVLIGSDSLTSLFLTQVAEFFKLLGSGSRFQSITRGVIDFRDLYYYLSITGVFLSLNALTLERLRWAGNKSNKRHQVWTSLVALCALNFIVGNFWLQQIGGARIDLSEGQVYSLSQVTRNYLSSLKEPLILRAYFSKKTHPFLSPLVPRMKDILKEYALAGNGKVTLEFVDPQEDSNVEREAVEKYGIKPVTFQTNNKYQAALTASYFDILIKYGDQFETLTFKDLIASKSMGENKFSIDLKNPEYDITRSIKKVITSYQSAGNPFLGIDKKIKLVGYVSPDEKLPTYLQDARKAYSEILENLKKNSDGKFSYEFVDPDADGGAMAKKLEQGLGFRPIPKSMSSSDTFWFYITLESPDKIVAMELPKDAKKEQLESDIKSGIKRFSRAFIKTIGIYSPPAKALMEPTADYRKIYNALTRKLEATHSLMVLPLEDGIVPDQVDLLLLLAPHKLSPKAVFAVDQFLMKGGTVIMVSSAVDTSINKPPPTARKEDSGLQDWLKSYGVEIEDAMVLDTQDFPFILPSTRNVSGYKVDSTELFAYPCFVDVRKDGMNANGDITAGLNQVTLTWPSPIKIDQEKTKQYRVTKLLQSSPNSWTSHDTNIVPYFSDKQKLGFPEGKDKGRKLIGVAVEGSFQSYFKGKKSPLIEDAEKKNDEKKDANNPSPPKPKVDKDKSMTNIIEKSPDSARIILFASNSFLGDRVLFLVSSSLGTTYDKPLELLDNAIDWSLEDRALLTIRGRGMFARTLRTIGPDPTSGAVLFEYGNYFLSALGLVLVWFIRRQVLHGAQGKYKRMLEKLPKPATPPAEEVRK